MNYLAHGYSEHTRIVVICEWIRNRSQLYRKVQTVQCKAEKKNQTLCTEWQMLRAVRTHGE